MMDRIDVTHIVLPGGEVKKEEAWWTSAKKSYAKAIFSRENTVALTQHRFAVSWGNVPVPDSAWTPLSWKLNKNINSVAKLAYTYDIQEKKKNRPESQKIPQHLLFKHTLTLCPQNRGHRRGSGMKSPVQT